MLVSQKCRYALRAVFELARREGRGAVKNSEIADAQAIPVRFLEVILAQLTRAGVVTSRRGSAGGYTLNSDPGELTVGRLIRLIDGPVEPVACVEGLDMTECRFLGDCAFAGMWERVREAVTGIYDSTTFLDLLEEERSIRARYVPSYAI
jgi:Rrf2 family protein